MSVYITNKDSRFEGLMRRLGCGCQPTEIIICFIVAANGRRHYRPRCGRCHHMPSFDSIPHALFNDEEKAAAFALRDVPEPQQCARCREWGWVENHHWAPREMFADSDAWPTSPLCPECHAEWHRIINANIRTNRQPTSRRKISSPLF